MSDDLWQTDRLLACLTHIERVLAFSMALNHLAQTWDEKGCWVIVAVKVMWYIFAHQKILGKERSIFQDQGSLMVYSAKQQWFYRNTTTKNLETSDIQHIYSQCEQGPPPSLKFISQYDPQFTPSQLGNFHNSSCVRVSLSPQCQLDPLSKFPYAFADIGPLWIC